MNFLKQLKRRFCNHVFIGYDLISRDETGRISWACSKCGKVFREECGLDVQRHGAIRGPFVQQNIK